MAKLMVLSLDWAVATSPRPGEPQSGDGGSVTMFSGGALAVVVDGVGHGPEAAVATRLALEVIERTAREAPAALVRRVHEGLLGTRGAVLSLASFDHRRHTVAWMGVGNVEGALLHAAPRSKPRLECLRCRTGIVGRRLPSLGEATLSVQPGDTLVFATDGVRPGFVADLDAGVAPQRLADLLLRRYRKGDDDALVLVARLREDPDDR